MTPTPRQAWLEAAMETDIGRFEELYEPEPTTGCWIWLGMWRGKGYGGFRVGGKIVGAHRWAYEHFIGPIPTGYVSDHLCRLRRCVNPWHVEPVTNGVNVLRGIGLSAVNARKTHCFRGHEFTESNTMLQSNGERACRTCGYAKWQRWFGKHRDARNARRRKTLAGLPWREEGT